MKTVNDYPNSPELQILGETVSQYDYLLQEGVFMDKEEKELAKNLVSQLERIIDEINTRGCE